MSVKNRIPVEFVNDVDLAISVMRNAAAWMASSGKNPSEHWQLGKLNREYLLGHANPSDFIVGLIDNKPAVACLLQDNERNQSWKYIDGNKRIEALYIHWLCVSRKFAGKRLPKAMINFAAKDAGRRKIAYLRLDTETDRFKLRTMYEKLRFLLMGTEENTVFYQKKLK